MAKLIWIWKLIINQKNASGSKSWRQIYIFYGKCPQISQNVVNFLTGTKFFVTCFHKWAILDNIRKFVDAIASPSTYPCQSVVEWVIDSFRFGDSYRIFELCELVLPDREKEARPSCITLGVLWSLLAAAPNQTCLTMCQQPCKENAYLYFRSIFGCFSMYLGVRTILDQTRPVWQCVKNPAMKTPFNGRAKK